MNEGSYYLEFLDHSVVEAMKALFYVIKERQLSKECLTFWQKLKGSVRGLTGAGAGIPRGRDVFFHDFLNLTSLSVSKGGGVELGLPHLASVAFSKEHSVSLTYDVPGLMELHPVATLLILNGIMRRWTPEYLLDEDFHSRRSDLRDFLDRGDPIKVVGIIERVSRKSVLLKDEVTDEFVVEALYRDGVHLLRRADVLRGRPAAALGIIEKLAPFEIRCAGLFVGNA